MTATHLVALLSSLAAARAPTPPRDTLPSPRVTIDAGVVVGAYFGPSRAERMFLGIPYAAPPVGARRWRPPERPAPWTHPRDASRFGAACPQSKAAREEYLAAARDLASAMPWYDRLTFDEDCLTLNVFTTAPDARARRPVIVWIHGGAGVAGTGALPPLGPGLARAGVVFVYINYRLGLLGLLAHPELSRESRHRASGNYAILDQIAALRWVQRNIARFGGDPARVTIMGSSAGSVYTCFLMATPLARGLFHRVIAESGGCRDYLMPELSRAIEYEEGHGSAEDRGRRLASHFGLAVDRAGLAALRRAPADEIVEQQSDSLLSLEAGATVDGWVLREQPALAFDAGRQARVPILVGSNADEMTIQYDPTRDPHTRAGYEAWIRGHFGPLADDALAMYPAVSDDSVRAAYIRLTTDYLYGYSSRLIATDQVRLGAPAYLYFFTFPPHDADAWLGAYHGAEMKYVGGEFRHTHAWPPTAADSAFGEAMRAFWVSFARDGRPAAPGAPAWSPYDPHRDECYELGTSFGPRPCPRVDRMGLMGRTLGAKVARWYGAR
jgi:para-nitrobenzyl esterase